VKASSSYFNNPRGDFNEEQKLKDSQAYWKSNPKLGAQIFGRCISLDRSVVVPSK
jgi:hypothetical protein